jgi:hypothetical protein
MANFSPLLKLIGWPIRNSKIRGPQKFRALCSPHGLYNCWPGPAAINGWTPTNFFWRSCLAFHFSRTLCFSLLSFNECSLFLLLRLVFIFLPWFVFRSCYIFASRCILTSGPCCYSSKELSQKGLNGVGKEKRFHAKKWYKKGLV